MCPAVGTMLDRTGPEFQIAVSCWSETCYRKAVRGSGFLSHCCKKEGSGEISSGRAEEGPSPNVCIRAPQSEIPNMTEWSLDSKSELLISSAICWDPAALEIAVLVIFSSPYSGQDAELPPQR